MAKNIYTEFFSYILIKTSENSACYEMWTLLLQAPGALFCCAILDLLNAIIDFIITSVISKCRPDFCLYIQWQVYMAS